MASNTSSAMSGLTEAQAREFHRGFMLGFVIYVSIAVVAHFLVWQWRPWLPGPEGYGSMGAVMDGVGSAVGAVLSALV